jgi:hypothetical protein
LRWVFGLLTVILVLYHISAVVQYAMADRFFDFAHYYLYARNLIEGHGFADVEGTHFLAEAIGHRQYPRYPAVYPAPFYFFLSPLALLPYHLASIAWLLLNELFLLAALFWCGAQRLSHSPARVAMLGVIVAAFQPLYETLALGQANLLLLAGIALTVRLWTMESSWSGFVLGLLVMVKPQFALLGLLWIRPTEWRHLGTAVATIGGLELGSLAVVGVEDWLIHVRYVRELPCEISLWALNISVRGFLFRLQGSCLADGFGDPMAVIAVLIGAAAIGMLAWYLWTHPPTDTSGRFHAASLILCTIFLVSPYTQEHHLTVLLIAFVGLALDRERSLEGIHRWGWVGAYVLLATAYSLDRFPFVHLGLPSILLFGKGVGVILLGVFLALPLSHKRRTPSALFPLLLVAVGGARAAHAILKVILIRQLDAALLYEIFLAAVLLLFWAAFFRARVAKVVT